LGATFHAFIDGCDMGGGGSNVQAGAGDHSSDH